MVAEEEDFRVNDVGFLVVPFEDRDMENGFGGALGVGVGVLSVSVPSCGGLEDDMMTCSVFHPLRDLRLAGILPAGMVYDLEKLR